MRLKAELPIDLTEDELTVDFQNAPSCGKVRLGNHCLYFPKFSGITCLPYLSITHAYIRQEEVNAKLCCGRANFDQFYLMTRGTDGKLRKAQVKSIEAGKGALAAISAANPAAEIGYHKPA